MRPWLVGVAAPLRAFARPSRAPDWEGVRACGRAGVRACREPAAEAGVGVRCVQQQQQQQQQQQRQLPAPLFCSSCTAVERAGVVCAGVSDPVPEYSPVPTHQVRRLHPHACHHASSIPSSTSTTLGFPTAGRPVHRLRPNTAPATPSSSPFTASCRSLSTQAQPILWRPRQRRARPVFVLAEAASRLLAVADSTPRQHRSAALWCGVRSLPHPVASRYCWAVCDHSYHVSAERTFSTAAHCLAAGVVARTLLHEVRSWELGALLGEGRLHEAAASLSVARGRSTAST